MSERYVGGIWKPIYGNGFRNLQEFLSLFITYLSGITNSCTDECIFVINFLTIDRAIWFIWIVYAKKRDEIDLFKLH